MTLQEMYDIAKARITLTGRCTNKHGNKCMYRNGSGGACAVGALIKDEHYTPECEKAGAISNLIVTDGGWRSADHNDPEGDDLAQALNRSGVPCTEEVHAFLMDLQVAHDLTRECTEKHKGIALQEMAKVAIKYGLVP